MRVKNKEKSSLRCKCCDAELSHDYDDEFYFSNDLCEECSNAVELELNIEDL